MLHNCGVHYSILGGFDYDGCYYPSFRAANEHLSGGLVVCERVDNDRDGRLRLHKIYAHSVQERKNGWYDLYTYTKTTGLLKGFYLCRILEFRGDKDNYVNMVVEILVFLGEVITSLPADISERIARSICMYDKYADMPAWEYLRSEMSPIAFDRIFHHTGAFNSSNASKKFPKDEAMKKLLGGEVSILNDISDALLEPTDMEKAVTFIQNNFWHQSFEDRYPLLSKKVKDLKLFQLEELMERKLEEFKTKDLEVTLLPGTSVQEEILVKVEATLKYWKDFNSAKKATKKAAKKAAKEAAKK